MKRIYVISAAVAAAIVIVCAALWLGVKLGSGSPSTAPSAATSTPGREEISLFVHMSTSNGLIAWNHDDRVCVWTEPAYILRDGDGRIVMAENITTEGARAPFSRWAAAGTITSLPPKYRCVLQWSIKTKPVDFYQLEVSVGNRTAEATFAHIDADKPIELQIG